jgi:hypothetical protein
MTVRLATGLPDGSSSGMSNVSIPDELSARDRIPAERVRIFRASEIRSSVA